METPRKKSTEIFDINVIREGSGMLISVILPLTGIIPLDEYEMLDSDVDSGDDEGAVYDEMWEPDPISILQSVPDVGRTYEYAVGEGTKPDKPEDDIFDGCWRADLAPKDRDEFLRAKSEMGWNLFEKEEVIEEEDDVFDNDVDDWGPSQEVSEFDESPIGLLFFFLPKSFWRMVASESSLYERQTRATREQKHREDYGEEQHEPVRTRTRYLLVVL